jgi:hypothetical protein
MSVSHLGYAALADNSYGLTFLTFSEHGVNLESSARILKMLDRGIPRGGAEAKLIRVSLVPGR